MSGVLVFGRTGQVAQELLRIGGVEALGRDAADLRDPRACAEAITARRPDLVINAAAFTAVDAAETDADLARVVNAEAPGAMARAAAAVGAPFVQISTDYVFDGSGDRPRRPDEPTSPVNAYGASKLGGEEAVRAAGGAHLILRTSWVFSAHGRNFVKTMLSLGRDRTAVSVVSDQIGGPTAAADIAAAVMAAGRALRSGGAGGTYHYAGAPDVSWADFARAIFETAGLSVQVNDIPSADYPTPAARPANSRLDCTSFERDFGIPRPDWRVSLANVVRELARSGA